MRLRATILPLIAMLAVPAMAQGVHFGFQVGLSSPQSDTKELVGSKMGYTAGILVPIQLEDGHTFRPRLDYTSANGSFNSGSGFTVDSKVTTTYLGLDYLYNISNKAGEGFYILFGAGYANSKIEASGLGTTVSSSKSTIAWGAGLGYDFTPMVGTELRYASTRPTIDNVFGSPYSVDFNNESFNLSVTFRF